MLAIIPARGGSKGLPGKNIKELLGKPLLAYTIESALNSKLIDEVIVSTDDEKIALVAKKYGATIPFIRPKELAKDDSLAVDNYIYTINRLNNEFGYQIEDFVVLQPTSPLRTSNDIDSAIEMFKKNKADSVISYTEEQHPISWHKYLENDLTLVNIFNEEIKNRQDYKISYYPNGAIYVFRFSLIQQRKYYSNKTFAYIMSRKNSIDIDTIDDFEYAEFLLSKTNEL